MYYHDDHYAEYYSQNGVVRLKKSQSGNGPYLFVHQVVKLVGMLLHPKKRDHVTRLRPIIESYSDNWARQKMSHRFSVTYIFVPLYVLSGPGIKAIFKRSTLAQLVSHFTVGCEISKPRF